MALTKNEVQRHTTIITGGGQRIQSGIAPENISHILSRLTKLYDNPVEATVREVISNGLDATQLMVEGERKPLEVTTPNHFNSSFIVRDFGVGMSLEEVSERYVNYGATSKQNELSAVGSHGLGGKAPLAYTDSFSVVTTKDGVTTSFTMERVNSIVESTIHSSKFTGEPSGTVVTVPVRTSDMEAFERALTNYRTYSWNSPILINGELFQGSEEFTDFGDVKIFEDEDTVVYGKIRVRRSALALYLNSIWDRSFSPEALRYELAGWGYRAEVVNGYKAPAPFVVSIVPGVVNFSSSRDSITVDEKLKRLNELVLNELQGNDKLITRAFEIFRSFSHKEISFFTRALRGEAFKLEDDQLILRTKYGKEVYRAPLTALDANVGVNPFHLKRTKGTRSISMALGWKSKDSGYGSEKLLSTWSVLDDTLLGQKASGTNVHKIGQLNQELRLEHPVYSLSSFASAFYDGERKFAVITEVSEASFKSLIRKREALESMGDDVVYALTASSESSLPKEDVTFAKLILEERFSVLSIEKLFENLKPVETALKGERRLARKDFESEILYKPLKIHQKVTELDDPVKAQADYFLEDQRRSRSIREIIASEHILILSPVRSWGDVYRGAVNAGEAILGKPIYIYDGKLTAAQFEALKPMKERIYVHPHFPTSSRPGNELKEERKFRSTYLDDEVNGFDLETLLLGSFGYFRQLGPEITDVLLQVTPKKSQLAFYLNLNKAWTEERKYVRLSQEDSLAILGERFGASYVKHVKNLDEVIHHIRYYKKTMDDHLLAMVMRFTGLPPKPELSDPITKVAVDILATRLTAALSAEDAV